MENIPPEANKGNGAKREPKSQMKCIVFLLLCSAIVFPVQPKCLSCYANPRDRVAAPKPR